MDLLLSLISCEEYVIKARQVSNTHISWIEKLIDSFLCQVKGQTCLRHNA
jgi:hypothetical protein